MMIPRTTDSETLRKYIYFGEADLLRRSYLGGSHYTNIYEGTFHPRTGSIISSYLRSHPREEVANYQRRQEVTNYENYTKWICDFFVQYIRKIRKQSTIIGIEGVDFSTLIKPLILYGQVLVERHDNGQLLVYNPTQYRYHKGQIWEYVQGQEVPFDRPCIFLYFGDEPMLSYSVLYDVAFENLNYYNLCSYLWEYIDRNTFALFTFEKGQSTAINNKDATVALGSDKILQYPNGTKTPSWITAPSAPADIIRVELERQERLMLLKAGLVSQTDNIQERHSALSVVLQSADKMAKLNDIAEQVQEQERSFYRQYAALLGNIWDGTVDYIELTADIPVGALSAKQIPPQAANISDEV